MEKQYQSKEKIHIECAIYKKKYIVLIKSHRNCNKGNYMIKSDSNKIMLWWSGGKHYLDLNKIST